MKVRRLRSACWRGEFLCEMPGQNRNVFAALAQGRQRERNHVQPVIKIAAELAALDHRRQRDIGRGDHADIDLDRYALRQAAQTRAPAKRAEFGLKVERHLADLVQQNRAAIGQFEFAGLGLRRRR